MKVMNVHRISNSLFLFICVLMAACSPNKATWKPAGGYLLEVTGEKVASGKDVASMIYGDMAKKHPDLKVNDVKLVSIKYKTEAPDGKPIVASGLIAIPEGIKEYKDLISLQHGTLSFDKAPSVTMRNGELAPAAYGNVMAMADNLGYGCSQTDDLRTPYLHLKYTGIPCADMIEAAKEYLAKNGIEAVNDSIVLMGYSQGGTSTIATLLELEKRGKERFIKDVRSGGGMYDIYDTFRAGFTQGLTDYEYSCFIPFIVRGMEYGENISFDAEKIYASEVLDKLGAFDTTQLYSWNKLLGSDLTKVLNKDFLAKDFNGNSEVVRLLEVLKENSPVYRQQPKTAVKMYHAVNDEIVRYAMNVDLMKQAWSNTTLIELEGCDTHGQGCVRFYEIFVENQNGK